MIQAGNYPITVRRGDTGTWQFELRETETDEFGQTVDLGPVDISAWTLTAIAKWDQNTVWFEFPVEFVTNGTDGRFQFYIDKPTSEGLLPVGSPPPDASTYEVQCSFLSGGRTEVATFLTGTFLVNRDLVRGSDATPPNP